MCDVMFHCQDLVTAYPCMYAAMVCLTAHITKTSKGVTLPPVLVSTAVVAPLFVCT